MIENIFKSSLYFNHPFCGLYNGCPEQNDITLNCGPQKPKESIGGKDKNSDFPKSSKTKILISQ